MRELQARVKALLRRASSMREELASPGDGQAPTKLMLGGLVID